MLSCWGNGVGEDFCDDSVDRVTYCDWSGVFDLEGEVLGEEVEDSYVEVVGWSDALREGEDDPMDYRGEELGELPKDGEGDAVGAWG